jgi:hypothetical protein
MATLSEMRTKIAGKLSDGELLRPTSSQIDDAINSTIDYYERRYFWFQEAKDTITTNSDSTVAKYIQDSELPSDFEFQQHPNSLVLQKNNYYFPLDHVQPRKYDLLQNDVTTSYPQVYTFRDGQIELFPTPDQQYTINLYYYKTFADLSSDSDTNDFLTNAERLIEYKTMLDLLEDYKDDDKRVPIYMQKVKDEEENVYNETYNRTSTGKLSTENIAEYGDNFNYFYRRNY